MSGSLRWIERMLLAALAALIIFCAWRIDDRANRTERYAQECVALVRGVSHDHP